MTLYLRIHKIAQLKQKGISGAYIFVQGSQSGALKSQNGPGGFWQPQFQIHCSNNDILTIAVSQDPKNRQEDFIGQTKFHAATFIKNHKKLSLTQQTQAQFNLVKNGQDVGVLCLRVTYDKAQKYQGQLPSTIKVAIQDNGKKNQVIFYKGKCKTTNLFSFLDKAAQGQEFKAVQSFYRDQDEL